MELCETYDFSATDLGFRWESHADQATFDRGAPECRTHDCVETFLLKKIGQEESKVGYRCPCTSFCRFSPNYWWHRTSRRVGVSKLYTKESISMLQESLSTTMAANYGGDVLVSLNVRTTAAKHIEAVHS
eukprot:752272-Hanusia_phi.AAC.1